MNEEILVNVTPMAARLAVVENGATQDSYIERQSSRGTVGNIYAGGVLRAMPHSDHLGVSQRIDDVDERARLQQVLASQMLVDRLLDAESANVGDLEFFMGRSVSFRAEPDYTQEQFDIVLL